MRYNLLASSLLIVSFSLGLTACGSDSDSNNHTSDPIINLPKPPIENTGVTLSGTIIDSFGAPLKDVTLQIGDQTMVTDNAGAYTLSIDDLDDNSVTVFIKKTGYLTTARKLNLDEGNTYQLNVALTANQVETLFEASTGITQQIDAGATVTIPANSIVKADGSAYVGTVNIAANYYNPDSVAGANAFAQPYAGVDADGENETPLVTVGVIDVKMTDANGNNLDLKDGSTATLSFPEASTDQDLATIPLWYYDEEQMVWVKDGVAIRQADGSYQGEVSHFTLWNLDIPLADGSAKIEGCIIDKETGEPPTQHWRGEISGRGYYNVGEADTEGKFSALVPINTPLTLSIPSYINATSAKVTVPAQNKDAIYQINNGNCIEVSFLDNNNEPVVVEPIFESLPTIPIQVPSTPPNVDGLIGYSFDLDIDDPESELRLVNVEMGTIASNANNTTTITLQSLYDTEAYVGAIDTKILNLTTQGISVSATYEAITNDSASITLNGQSYTANSATQVLPNGFVSTANFQTESLSGQKIGDVLIPSADVYYDDVGDDIINKFNSLPNSANTFDADATCLKPIDYMVNQDYIESLWALPNLSFADAVAGFDSDASKYNRGTWGGIPWISELPDLTDDDEPIAYFEYSDTVYAANYHSIARSQLDNSEKEVCGFFNEAAKEQIIAALEEAYPAL